MNELRSLSRGGTTKSRSSVFGIVQVGARLQWKQPRWGVRRWELWTDTEAVGAIERHGFVRDRWIIEGPSGPWNLKRNWRGHRWIGRPKDRESAVHYQPAWRGGRLRLADATRLVWKRTSLGSPNWAIANEEGHPYVLIHARRGLRIEATVRFDISARRLSDPEPLLLLGWALVLDARAHAR